MISREALYQTIDQLPESTFLELVQFVEFLKFKNQLQEWQGDDVAKASDNKIAEKKRFGKNDTRINGQKKRSRRAGSAKHLNIKMADDFDEPLEDFAEYM